MPIIRSLNELDDANRGGAVAIGNFDGVHRGHLEIVRRLIQRAKEVGGPAIVFTFDPHPVRILRPAECPPPLTWTERKAQLLAAHGVSKVVAYPTDESLLELSASAFFEKIVVGSLRARAMVEGPNFYFGHNREGNVELLAQLTESAGITLDVVEPVEVEGGLVSSSRIRELIAQGEISQANRMLSAPYRIRGMVTHGAGRGNKLGFPTANLEAIDTLLPREGVYAGSAWLGPNRYDAAISLGINATFGESIPKVEVHLLDFQETIYGQPLEVEFLRRLRDMQTFDSEESLIRQLQQDIRESRQIVPHAFFSENS